MSAAAALIRVVVDPNGASRLNPDWTAVLLKGLDGELAVSDHVLAVQPGNDGWDYVGEAVVRAVDTNHGLAYLEVAWDSFVDVPAEPAHRLVDG